MSIVVEAVVKIFEAVNIVAVEIVAVEIVAVAIVAVKVTVGMHDMNIEEESDTYKLDGSNSIELDPIVAVEVVVVAVEVAVAEEVVVVVVLMEFEPLVIVK